MLRLDLKGAMESNALAPLAFVGCVIYFVLALVDLFIEKSLVEKFENMLISKKTLPFYLLCVLWKVINY